MLEIPAQRLTGPARRTMPRFGLIQQPRFLPLPVFLLVVLWGCASPLTAPPQQRVILKTSASTQYYSVRGTATGAIFDDIERNNLFDNKGDRAVGLTSAEWRMDWIGIGTHAAFCSPPPMTITVKLMVTLPQHDHVNDLSEDIRTHWQRFAARVAAHEQRHVDIYLDGANAMKTRMETTLTKWSSCAELETSIRSLWADEQAEIESAQDRFHAEDKAKSENDRKPLQTRIDVNKARLASIETEIRSLDQTLDGLRRQLDAARAKIDAVKVEIAKSDGANCSQARPTSQVQTLCQEHNGLVAAHNTLTEQHNRVAYRRNNLVEEHHQVLAATNGLIEALNWTR
jgi:predicted secreted Zn-dependent protease